MPIKQKTIVQICGAQGCGKTSTIQLTKEELILNYINPSHTYTFPLKKAEISVLLLCNGHKIGIESMGDDIYSGSLNTRLDDFIVTDKVDILLCASRVYNNVDVYLKKMASLYNYRILKATNYRSEDVNFSQDHLNLLSAKHLVLFIDELLNGNI